MNTHMSEQMSQMSTEMTQLRRRLAGQQAILLGLVVIGAVAFCTGAASQDGHFNRVYANSVIIRSDSGETAASLYASNDGGALLIRDSSGKEAIHIISGSERNDVLINDRNNGEIAVAIQGMKDRGRLSLLRTFPNKDAAEAALGQEPQSYLSNSKTGKVTVPQLRIP